ncbi:hypothetical protein DPMN_086429 [Dreissena polymorpha]|uniref:Uncharacterized protein n=1 Tax=Dreissena polymorpha TaxID=45954 RepID=A0A9D4KRF9_DREPO|nr:hypothetical protein DPMN_086429 [Dreissena polymorpha]
MVYLQSCPESESAGLVQCTYSHAQYLCLQVQDGVLTVMPSICDCRSRMVYLQSCPVSVTAGPGWCTYSHTQYL